MIYSTNIKLFLRNISFFLKKDLFIYLLYAKRLSCFYSVVLSHLLLLLITVYITYNRIHMTLQFIMQKIQFALYPHFYCIYISPIVIGKYIFRDRINLTIRFVIISACNSMRPYFSEKYLNIAFDLYQFRMHFKP